MFLACALLASPASAARDGSADVVRDLAVRVGPIVGGTLACREIVRSRPQITVDKFHTIIRDAAWNEAGRTDVDRRMLKQIADDGYGPARAPPSSSFAKAMRFSAMSETWSTLNSGRGEHQASYKIWGTALDEAAIFQPIDLE